VLGFEINELSIEPIKVFPIINGEQAS